VNAGGKDTEEKAERHVFLHRADVAGYVHEATIAPITNRPASW
jgi:hypothetical protein